MKKTEIVASSPRGTRSGWRRGTSQGESPTATHGGEAVALNASTSALLTLAVDRRKFIVAVRQRSEQPIVDQPAVAELFEILAIRSPMSATSCDVVGRVPN